jgi:hypothetical protein
MSTPVTDLNVFARRSSVSTIIKANRAVEFGSILALRCDGEEERELESRCALLVMGALISVGSCGFRWEDGSAVGLDARFISNKKPREH